MPAVFKKTMLKVGSYRSPDGVVKVTPDRLKHWQANFHRLKTRGKQTVPMHWDHADNEEDLKPIPDEEFQAKTTRSARNSVGRMIDFKVLPSGKQAEIHYQLHCPKAIQKMKANDVFVSPVIWPKSLTDSRGNVYQDLFTHLDVVNYPVDHSQGPAIEVKTPVCCSVIRMGMKAPYKLEEDVPDKKFPADPLESNEAAEAQADPFEMDAVDSATETLDAIDGDDDGSLDLDLDLDELDPGDDAPPEDTDTLDVSAPGVGDILLALAEHDIVLPPDTDDSNFMDRLRTALVATSPKNDGEAPDNPFDTGDTVAVDPQVATMSLYGRFATEQFAEKLSMGMEKLLKTGRCTPAEYREHVAEIPAQRLSLNPASGKPKGSKLTDWMKSRAALPPGAVWSPKERLKRMSVVETKKPDDITFNSNGRKQLSQEEISKLTNLVLS
jgi:hypothetical protein